MPKAIFCRNCGALMSADDARCMDCGWHQSVNVPKEKKSIMDSLTKKGNPKTPTSTFVNDSLVCSKCGAIVGSDIQFCMICGWDQKVMYTPAIDDMLKQEEYFKKMQNTVTIVHDQTPATVKKPEPEARVTQRVAAKADKMGLPRYNTLIRDKMPANLRAEGRQVVYRSLSGEVYITALNLKLLEEVNDFIENQSVEGLVEIGELMYAFLALKGVSLETFQQLRQDKFKKLGGYEKRLVLKEFIDK